jgi:hypothetical protein
MILYASAYATFRSADATLSLRWRYASEMAEFPTHWKISREEFPTQSNSCKQLQTAANNCNWHGPGKVVAGSAIPPGQGVQRKTLGKGAIKDGSKD